MTTDKGNTKKLAHIESINILYIDGKLQVTKQKQSSCIHQFLQVQKSYIKTYKLKSAISIDQM